MVLGFVLLYLLACPFVEKRCDKAAPGMALASACLLFMLYVYCTTEVLSLFFAISGASLWCAWIVLDLVLAFLVAWQRDLTKGQAGFAELAQWVRGIVPEGSAPFFAVAACLLAIFVCTSLSIVPNNSDSLSYHLTRVAVWNEQGSVAHFATNNTFMLGSPPLSEFWDLQIYAMVGHDASDSFLNLRQTASYFVCLGLVATIACLLGCRRPGAIVAVCIFAGVPTVVSEAFSEQTDIFTTVWVLSFAAFAVSLARDGEAMRKPSPFYVLGLGVSAGFVCLAKLSGLFVVIALALMVLVSAIVSRVNPGWMIAWVACVAAVAVVVVAPEAARNLETYGELLDPWQGPGQLAQTADPAMLLVNFLKNVGTNISYGLFPGFLEGYTEWVQSVADALGVQIDSEVISENGLAFDLEPTNEFKQDASANIVFFALFVAMLVAYVWKCIAHRRLLPYYTIFASASFLAMLFFVKWEICMARYLVPCFGVLAPAMGCVFQPYIEEIGKRARASGATGPGALGAVAAFASVIMLGAAYNYQVADVYYDEKYDAEYNGVKYEDRRERAYYDALQTEYWTKYLPLEKALDGKNVRTIGFDLSDRVVFDYPLLRLIEQHCGSFYTVNAKNSTAKYEEGQPAPDYVVIAFPEGEGPEELEEYEYAGVKYGYIQKLSDSLYLASR